MSPLLGWAPTLAPSSAGGPSWGLCLRAGPLPRWPPGAWGRPPKLHALEGGVAAAPHCPPPEGSYWSVMHPWSVVQGEQVPGLRCAGALLSWGGGR